MRRSASTTPERETSLNALLLIGSIYLLNEAASRQGVGLLFLWRGCFDHETRSGLSSPLWPYLARFRDLASWSFFVTCCCHVG